MTDTDHIAELEAENAQLREALQVMHDRYQLYCDCPDLDHAGDTDKAVMEFARAALARTGEDG